jgi:cobalamin biosynthesis Mg chelatase CobN
MPAVEPHPRRRALRRGLLPVVAAVALVLGAPVAPVAAGQLLPTTTTEPTPTTTEPTTTTTEVEPVTTTTEGSTATTRATTTTTTTTTDAAADEDTVIDEDGDGVIEDEELDGGVGDEAPAETSSTVRDLLVRGDGSEGAESTTTTSTTVVEVAAEDGSLDEETQIWLIVAGLVMVAFLIGVWTWRYWVRTKPVAGPEEPDPTTVFPT